jgi:hypothetical protein
MSSRTRRIRRRKASLDVFRDRFELETNARAKTQTEKLQLIEAGFEFVSADPDGTQYFRKRK